MTNESIEIIIEGEKRQVKKGITLLELSQDYQEEYEGIIVLGIIDNKLCELENTLTEPCIIDFLSTADQDGLRTYQRSATFVLIKAIFDIMGKEEVKKIIVHFSLSKGYYCELDTTCQLNQEILDQVKERMKEIIDADLPIEKRTVSSDEAMTIFKENKMVDKEKLFNYRRVSNVNLYRLGDVDNYFYGYMVPSTGYIKYFDLYLYDEGFVLQFPTTEQPKEVPVFEPQHKLFRVMKQSALWGKMLNVDTVGALNDVITEGKIKELMMVSEALQEKRIAEIADEIVHQNKRVVLVAGPSSSGKTTFAHRLAIQLRVHGAIPHPLSVDDYFVDRDRTPLDEEGNPDFESLNSIDLEQFNQDMKRIITGERVQIPTYNFKTGKREYRGHEVALGPKDYLVIEGIHGLNDALTYALPEHEKFKIYISALTQLNVDEQNRIPTTDGRLIRRMVRDHQYRGANAQDTIAMWPSVRRGEEKYIFPHQEKADVMFNSALLYELSILKQYAEPLLFSIPKDSVEYLEAKRLIKFLDYFLSVSSDDVPKNSLLREFIGGSIFH